MSFINFSPIWQTDVLSTAQVHQIGHKKYIKLVYVTGVITGSQSQITSFPMWQKSSRVHQIAIDYSSFSQIVAQQRANMTKLYQISCSYQGPLQGASVKVHHFRCSRDLEISSVHKTMVNFTSFCWITAYILKVVCATKISSRKCQIYNVGVQQIVVYC